MSREEAILIWCKRHGYVMRQSRGTCKVMADCWAAARYEGPSWNAVYVAMVVGGAL